MYQYMCLPLFTETFIQTPAHLYNLKSEIGSGSYKIYCKYEPWSWSKTESHANIEESQIHLFIP